MWSNHTKKISCSNARFLYKHTMYSKGNFQCRWGERRTICLGIWATNSNRISLSRFRVAPFILLLLLYMLHNSTVWNNRQSYFTTIKQCIQHSTKIKLLKSAQLFIKSAGMCFGTGRKSENELFSKSSQFRNKLS